MRAGWDPTLAGEKVLAEAMAQTGITRADVKKLWPQAMAETQWKTLTLP